MAEPWTVAVPAIGNPRAPTNISALPTRPGIPRDLAGREAADRSEAWSNRFEEAPTVLVRRYLEQGRRTCGRAALYEVRADLTVCNPREMGSLHVEG